jgi:hypothetical protein
VTSSASEKQEEAGALSRHLFGLTNIRFFSLTETSCHQNSI